MSKKLLAVLLIGFGAIVVFTSNNLGVEFVGMLAATIGAFLLGIKAKQEKEQKFPADVGVG